MRGGICPSTTSSACATLCIEIKCLNPMSQHFRLPVLRCICSSDPGRLRAISRRKMSPSHALDKDLDRNMGGPGKLYGHYLGVQGVHVLGIISRIQPQQQYGSPFNLKRRSDATRNPQIATSMPTKHAKNASTSKKIRRQVHQNSEVQQSAQHHRPPLSPALKEALPLMHIYEPGN